MNKRVIKSLIIPQSGRIFENFMKQLSNLISNDKNIIEIIEIIKNGKKYKSSSLIKALYYLEKYKEFNYPLSLFIDRKREDRPYRVGFIGSKFKLKDSDIDIQIEGAESHNCTTLVSLGEADISLAGFDELLITTQEKLIYPSIVTKWGLYNYNLPTNQKVRIVGSAMIKIWNSSMNEYIQDIVGFFLIGKYKLSENDNYGYTIQYLKHLEKYKNVVYVKSRYADMVKSAYPKLNIISTYDVEDSILESKNCAVGLEIVQSGNTLKDKNLFLFGEPLFLSESLYIANYDNYSINSKEFNIIFNTLKPVGYYDDERLEEFAKWFYALKKNLGENWINRPNNISNLLSSKDEILNGLRPYRLQTRYWSPDDKYKIYTANEKIKKSKIKLINMFNKIKLENK